MPYIATPASGLVNAAGLLGLPDVPKCISAKVGSLNVHSACSLNVHSICSLTVHSMITQCSLDVHSMFTRCSLTVH
jgi:hypothetical protein